jgi:hypothetical protein
MNLFVIILCIVVIWIWWRFNPALEVTREKELLLFYDTYRGRDYVKIMQL